MGRVSADTAEREKQLVFPGVVQSTACALRLVSEHPALRSGWDIHLANESEPHANCGRKKICRETEPRSVTVTCLIALSKPDPMHLTGSTIHTFLAPIGRRIFCRPPLWTFPILHRVLDSYETRIPADEDSMESEAAPASSSRALSIHIHPIRTITIV
jgi:hypothetical protein